MSSSSSVPTEGSARLKRLARRFNLSSVPDVSPPLYAPPSPSSSPRGPAEPPLLEVSDDVSVCAAASPSDPLQRVHLLRAASSSAAPAAVARFSPNDGDAVTALCWVPVGRRRKERRFVLAVGFRTGIIRLFADDGALLLTQVLHKARVLRLKASPPPLQGASADAVLAAPLPGLLALYPGVLCHVEGAALAASLTAAAEDAAAAAPDAAREESKGAADWPYDKWALQGQEDALDVSVCGDLQPQPLAAELAGLAIRTKPRLLAGGRNPALAVYVPGERTGKGLTAVAQAGSWIASRVASTVFSFARSWLDRGGGGDGNGGGGGGGGDGGDDAADAAVADGPVRLDEVRDGPAEGLRHARCFKDAPRAVERLAMAPNQRLALAADSLGRVLLVDAQHLVVLRVWKGYRDAQCCFVRQEGADGARSRTLAVLYAPRRGQLELWTPLGQQRVGAALVGPEWALRQTGSRAVLVSLATGAVREVGAQKRKRQRAAVRALPATPEAGGRDEAGGEDAPAATAAKDPAELLPAFRNALKAWRRRHTYGGDAPRSRVPLPSEYGDVSAAADAYLVAAFPARAEAPAVRRMAAATPLDRLAELERALIGPDGLVPLHRSASAEVKGRPYQANLSAVVCMDVAQRAGVAVERRVRALEAQERSGLRNAAIADEIEAARAVIGRVMACVALLQTYAALSRCADRRDEPDGGAPDERGGGGGRPAPRLGLHDFLGAFYLPRRGDGGGHGHVDVRPGLSPAMHAVLAAYVFGQPFTYHLATAAFTHLKCSGLPPRRVTALFAEWYASLRAPGAVERRRPGGIVAPAPSLPLPSSGAGAAAAAGSASDPEVAVVVRGMATVYNQDHDDGDGQAEGGGSDDTSVQGDFFRAAARFCRSTTQFQHGVRLARLCARLESEDDADGGPTAAAWTSLLEEQLSSLELVRSYLPDVERGLVTVECVRGEWPVARLLAAQVFGRDPGGAADWWPAGAAATRQALEIAGTGLTDLTAARKSGRVLRGVSDAAVRACRHLISPDFGFAGGGPAAGADAVLFYCAHRAYSLHAGRRLQTGAALRSCVEHLECVRPGRRAGGLALYVWTNALSTHVQAIMACVRRGARGAGGGPATLHEARPPYLLPMLQSEWGHAPELVFSVLVLANRVLTVVQRSAGKAAEEEAAAAGGGEDAGAAAATAANAATAGGPLASPPDGGPMMRAAERCFDETAARCPGLAPTLLLARRVVATLGECVEVEMKTGRAPRAPDLDAMFPRLAVIELLQSRQTPELDALLPPGQRRVRRQVSGPSAAAAAAAGAAAPPDSVRLPPGSAAAAARLDFCLSLFSLLPQKPLRHHFGLADFVGLGADAVRREFVLALLQRGGDRAAEELMHQVEDRPALVPGLLRVAFERCVRAVAGAQEDRAAAEHLVASIPQTYWEFLQAKNRPWSPPQLRRPVPVSMHGAATPASAVHLLRVVKGTLAAAGGGAAEPGAREFCDRLLAVANLTAEALEALKQR